MRIKKYLLPSLLACTVLALAARHFVRPAAAESIPDADPYEAIDNFVAERLQSLNVPGASLAITEGDQIVHLRSFGRANPDGDAPTAHTPFMIGSLTKSVTALGVMQLVEAGKVDLNAPVQQYLPWFRVADARASAQITVRHLLNQTGGLSTNSGWIPMADFDDSPGATERQARALSTFELSHPVGTAFEYSNANYNLLGLIIEAASGQTYPNYVRDHIFTPLGMDHTYTDPAEAKQDGLAVGHQFWFWTPVAAPDLPVPLGSLPSGQLISTAEDMAHYMIALLNDGRYGDAQIISAAGIAEMHRGVSEHIAMGIDIGKYGMGWYSSQTGGTRVVWHTGMVPDFSSYMGMLPEQNKGVVLLLNADHFMMDPVLAEFGDNIASLLAGGQPAPSQFGFLPWAMRSQLLIPLLQVVGVVLTLRSLRRWRQDPLSQPEGVRKWGLHVALPLVLNGLVMLLLIPLLGPMRGFWRLFMPDYSTVAMVSGGIAGAWGIVRTGLVLRALQKTEESKSVARQVEYAR